jgi:hypothetical protein
VEDLKPPSTFWAPYPLKLFSEKLVAIGSAFAPGWEQLSHYLGIRDLQIIKGTTSIGIMFF